jgi:hypothetical protein
MRPHSGQPRSSHLPAADLRGQLATVLPLHQLTLNCQTACLHPRCTPGLSQQEPISQVTSPPTRALGAVNVPVACRDA